ncbi:protein ALP1-like [Lathyrus oleraceus]|uniref:protein ALP1-like n=1 Tax=Pisum sativum TaxID=3888 RepID=UPI0021D0D6DE|nr:protein ALP1-like [Pisum sativum]
MGEALSAWAKASLVKAERYMDRSVEATLHVTSDYSLTKCMTLLDEMEDIPHDAYGKALEKFMNFDWRKVFIVLTRIDIYESDDSTSDASDDEFAEFLFNSMIYNYHQKYFNKAKVLTSSLTGHLFAAENCISAIDGTHISASVPVEKQISCRDRKTTITQNVMCACDFNMMFTYVYSGWEGSAHDSKILLDAITNQNAEFPWPPRGSFYLIDSGYPCIGGFLPPYRGERYHAQEYRGQGRQPRSPEELFNYRHLSLRMTIEHCFRMLKNGFPILKLMPSYKPFRKRLIVIGCCVIHNYIRK